MEDLTLLYVHPAMDLSGQYPLHKINSGRNQGQFPKVHFNTASSFEFWHSQKQKNKKRSESNKRAARRCPSRKTVLLELIHLEQM